jgi:hypothetical protein
MAAYPHSMRVWVVAAVICLSLLAIGAAVLLGERGGSAGIGGSITYNGGPLPGAGDGREPGEVVVYDENGSEVARQTVEARDGFGFTLEPGTYRLVTTSGDASCKDTTIRLTDGQFVDMVVTCDVR